MPQSDKTEGLSEHEIDALVKARPHEFEALAVANALRCRVCGKTITAQEIEECGGAMTLTFDCIESWAR